MKNNKDKLRVYLALALATLCSAGFVAIAFVIAYFA